MKNHCLSETAQTCLHLYISVDLGFDRPFGFIEGVLEIQIPSFVLPSWAGPSSQPLPARSSTAARPKRRSSAAHGYPP